MNAATTVLEETVPPLPILIRPGIDSRPPAHRWRPIALAERARQTQPSLLSDSVPDDAPPRPTGVRFRSGGPGTPAPAPGLPDPGEWTAVLALAVAQSLHGLRPVGQLERWLAESVLADLRGLVRRRDRRDATGRRVGRPTPPISVVSVRAQCPVPTAAEAAAHLRVASRSLALAVRLEALGDRWLCVALELGPID